MHHDADMRRTKSQAAKAATRITVTLPQQNYEIVVRMAKNKRVSTSWIVRDAVANYLAADTPLLANLERPE